MKTLFTGILTFALVALTALMARADTFASASLTAGTASTLLSAGGSRIFTLTFTATSANATTVKVYDSSSGTNVIRPTYTSFVTYSTNFNSVFTNESGVVITNTFVGQFTAPVINSAVTNERPALATFVVTGNGQRTIELDTSVARGLVAVANQTGVLEVRYDKQ